jgi:hypothetical protein
MFGSEFEAHVRSSARETASAIIPRQQQRSAGAQKARQELATQDGRGGALWTEVWDHQVGAMWAARLGPGWCSGREAPAQEVSVAMARRAPWAEVPTRLSEAQSGALDLGRTVDAAGKENARPGACHRRGRGAPWTEAAGQVGPSGVPDLDTAVSGRRNVRPRGVWPSQMTWHSVDRGGARWPGGT